MDIKSDAQPMLVEPGHKARGIREELLIPGVAGPAAAILRRNGDHMPIHIDDRHGEGQTLGFKTFNQLAIGRLAIAIEATPPVAQGILRQEGLGPSQAIEVGQASPVVMAIAKVIEVLAVALLDLVPTILSQL